KSGGVGNGTTESREWARDPVCCSALLASSKVGPDLDALLLPVKACRSLCHGACDGGRSTLNGCQFRQRPRSPDVSAVQLSAGNCLGAATRAHAVYVDRDRARTDLLGESGSVQSDCSLFAQCDRTPAVPGAANASVRSRWPGFLTLDRDLCDLFPGGLLGPELTRSRIFDALTAWPLPACCGCAFTSSPGRAAIESSGDTATPSRFKSMQRREMAPPMRR